MKFNFITFMVRDIKKSIVFYRELVDLQIVKRISLAEGEIVFLANDKDETMLELIEFEQISRAFS